MISILTGHPGSKRKSSRVKSSSIVSKSVVNVCYDTAEKMAHGAIFSIFGGSLTEKDVVDVKAMVLKARYYVREGDDIDEI